MKYLYVNGKYRSVNADNASIMMHAFNYGTAAFEGMKAFYRKKEKNWFIFRPDQHFKRFRIGAKALNLKLRIDANQFCQIISSLIKKNNIKTDIYIRPLIYRDALGVGLQKPSDYSLAVYMHSVPPKKPKTFKACLVSQRRPIDGTYSVKLAGNYLLSFFAQREASKKGYDLGILLSTDGYLAEASLMNLFFTENGKVFTPAVSCGPLAGITRQSVIQITQQRFGVKVFEGKYRWKRLLGADEIFLTGTGSGINYISQVNKKRFRLSRNDRLAPQVWDFYKEIVYGKTGLFQDWMIPV
jgi:branched-chain amino acid aminotransferase